MLNNQRNGRQKIIRSPKRQEIYERWLENLDQFGLKTTSWILKGCIIGPVSDPAGMTDIKLDPNGYRMYHITRMGLKKDRPTMVFSVVPCKTHGYDKPTGFLVWRHGPRNQKDIFASPVHQLEPVYVITP